ncbi:Cell division protein DivIC (FtsB), stabilizes FtsL against RasP cleavage [Winogradskyella psychrotolerans RS-3]|uniref:Cell division protein DivIC (FtsB), stabilizes FtsL against RasP cleavage n=2 Tax=Winogradskyella TaxID=286104 RepID=S7VW68_9FLAO|nr:Cell division protein DivIC (FtsB), stabilizes FtsL against RasP cleavage [Winogradskyella psychrotolerans RS-3]
MASVCFLLSFWLPTLYAVAWIVTIIIAVLLLIDILLLYQPKNAIHARRILPDKFSNSDNNPVPITITNKYGFKTYIDVIDELPVQFQKRDFLYQTSLNPNQNHDFEYLVRPVDRGEYYFGHLNIFVSSVLKIVKRKYKFQNQQMVMVYPSIIQMQKYDFLAISNSLTEFGLKKIRRIGNTSEFEQIKDYIPGDDFRTVNWKATAKRGQLMVNQYQDEKSQPIYSIIDTGRIMKMPFNGLKLLDYAINSTLTFSNVALKKHDKVGMISFSKKIESFLPAIQKITYLNRILENLYNIDTQFNDSDFGLLYAQLKRKVTHRSLLLLYTNFEHISALKRQMPYLQAISKKHMLVVVLFENTELDIILKENAEDLQSIYHKTIAEKFAFEKRLMVKELQKHGIQSILTAPENLTINTINKYLEIKARGLL